MLAFFNPFSSKGKRMRALFKEAGRRGMTIDELSKTLTTQEISDIVDRATPGPDLTRWGLVPKADLVSTPSAGVPAVDGAVEAANGGDWKPAARLLADSLGQWDFHACAVDNLAEVAADDDAWLTAWRAECPDDAHTEVVDSAALITLAWQLRGTKQAAETSREQFADFRRVLAQAETAATAATRALPDDPTPWYTLVTIARGLGYDHARFDEIWQCLIERAPLHRRGHRSALQYWCAKWQGSHEKMLAFAEQAAASSPSLSMLVVRAAYEKQFEDRQVWQQQNVRDAVDATLRWLETDGADNVDLRDDLGWAALALVESGRGGEAIPIFQRLGTYAGGQPWSYAGLPAGMFHEYRVRACKAR
jgi:hypothetical protein